MGDPGGSGGDIGSGGNGLVHEVEHVLTGRRLALKSLLDESSYGRLEQEALFAERFQNWFWGAGYVDFATPPRSPLALFEFYYREPSPMLFWRGMLFAGLMAWFMAWIGMHAGRAMQKVRR